MSTRRIPLATAERFELWGRVVASLKVESTGPVAWTDYVSCRDSRGELIGSVTPGRVVEVSNALLSRGRLR